MNTNNKFTKEVGKIMKRMKKLFTVCFCMIMITSLCSGCGSKETLEPEMSMKAFYQLLIGHNSQGMTDLGIDAKEAEKTLSTYKEQTKSSLKKSFKSANLAVTDADLEKIYASISDAMSNLEYSINTKNKDDDKASIQLSTQTIDYVSVMKTATDTTVSSLKVEHVETQKAATKLLVTNICKGFKEYKPADTKAKKTFEFTKQTIKSGDEKVSLYFPEDAEAFGNQLINLVIEQ